MSFVKARLAVLAAVGVWLVLLFPTIEDSLTSDDDSLGSQVADKAHSVMHNFAAELLPDLISNIADFHWGGFVFLIGLIGFTVFCLAKSIKG